MPVGAGQPAHRSLGLAQPGRQATPEEPPLAAAVRVAAARGEELGAGFRKARALGRLGPERALTVASELLERYGYEPERPGPHTVRLRNCPFHALARRAPEVVCAINQALLEGLLRGLGDRRGQAVLAPRPDACCVELRAAAARR